METKMVAMEGSLREIYMNMERTKRGMEYVAEQVDHSEQNLQVDPAHPSLPSQPLVYQPQPLQEPELPGAR
eukprot:3950904-Prorocentrum_lima.AAC.1